MQQQTYKAVKNLLSEGSTNYKTAKNELLTYILYLAPGNISGINICPFASPGCLSSCLYSAGRGAFNNVQKARINRTLIFKENRHAFYIQLANELMILHDKAIKNSIYIAIRLNGTSDIDHISLLKKYTGINFLDSFYSSLKFYDYTKSPVIAKKYIGTSYKITFSRSEINNKVAFEILAAGGNIAIVFKNELPETFVSYPVIDGDISDLRYYDPKNVIIGLKAKGKAKKDLSGFVIDINK